MDLQRIGWMGIGAAVLVGGLVSYRMLWPRPPVHKPKAHATESAKHADEAAPSVPKRPSCDGVRAKTADRLAAQLGYDNGPQWSMQCQGVLLRRGGAFVQGLAIAIQARTRGDGGYGIARGVTTPDGTKDIVPFGPMRMSLLAGAADLDHDGSDELMFFGDTEVFISRITATGFHDVEGPETRGTCLADATLEDDRIILTVPSGLDHNCYEAGRHAYALQDDEIVKTR